MNESPDKKVSPGKFKRIQEEAQAFLEEKDVPVGDDASTPRWRQFAQFWLIVAKTFARNRCPVHAASLAYTTLLSLIPLLALVISVSTSLIKSQGEDSIKQMINKVVGSVAPQLDLMSKTGGESGEGTPASGAISQGRQQVVDSIAGFIGNVRSGTLGVTGAISLILVVILLLSNIEKTLNDIWGVTQGRTWVARVVQYWAAITLGPVLLIVTMGLTSGPYFTATKRLLSYLPFVGALLFEALPFLFMIGGFSVFYRLMPNARVHWKAALVGGIVGGGLWQLNSLLNVFYVSKVVGYSKTYGSFGMLPVFMVGIYFSWLILLFGAQVSYAFQNRQVYLQEKQVGTINQLGREFVALRVLAVIGQRFQLGDMPPTLSEIGAQVGASTRLVTSILLTLTQARLIAEVANGVEGRFIPARPLDRIASQDVLQALRAGQGHEPNTRDGYEKTVIREEIDRIRQAEKQAATAINLEQIVNRLNQGGSDTQV
jgi:membrane protein